MLITNPWDKMRYNNLPSWLKISLKTQKKKQTNKNSKHRDKLTANQNQIHRGFVGIRNLPNLHYAFQYTYVHHKDIERNIFLLKGNSLLPNYSLAFFFENRNKKMNKWTNYKYSPRMHVIDEMVK